MDIFILDSKVVFFFLTIYQPEDYYLGPKLHPGAHCTEIDFALSFGAVIVKMIDLSKTGTRDFFDIILD